MLGSTVRLSLKSSVVYIVSVGKHSLICDFRSWYFMTSKLVRCECEKIYTKANVILGMSYIVYYCDVELSVQNTESKFIIFVLESLKSNTISVVLL